MNTYYFSIALKKHHLLLLFITLFAQTVLAQLTIDGAISTDNGTKKKPPYQDTVWVISGKKVLDKKYKKWKFDLSFDARQTIIGNTQARLGGLRIGMEYRRVNRFGLGIYNFSDGVKTNSLSSIGPDVSLANLNLSYFSIYYERVLAFNKYIEWSTTIHRGIGNISGYYVIGTGPTAELKNFDQVVRPLEISTTNYFHLTYFISVGVGVGYRYIRNVPTEITKVYNAPIALFRFRFKFIKMIAGAVNEDIRHAY